MAALSAGLNKALSSQGQLFLLAGEPGIGKTRLASELASEARQRGACVLWGRCYEGEGAPPYWPWVQILRAYVTDCDPHTLRTELGAGAGEIAQLIPEVREQLPDVSMAAGSESEQARFRLFDSVTIFLKHA